MKLNVKKIPAKTLQEHWGVRPFRHQTSDNHCYVRCNAKGEVNYDKTLIYDIDELIVKNDVNIIK